MPLGQKQPVESSAYHVLFEFQNWDRFETTEMRAVLTDGNGKIYPYPFTVQAEPKSGDRVDIGTFSCTGAVGLYAQTPNAKTEAG